MNTLIVLDSSVARLLVLGGKTPKCTDRKRNHVLILRERAPQKHIFSGLKVHLPTYTINAVSFIIYLWFGARNDIIQTKH